MARPDFEEININHESVSTWLTVSLGKNDIDNIPTSYELVLLGGGEVGGKLKYAVIDRDVAEVKTVTFDDPQAEAIVKSEIKKGWNVVVETPYRAVLAMYKE